MELMELMELLNNKPFWVLFNIWILAEAYGCVVQFELHQGVKKGKQVTSCTIWKYGENVVSRLKKCLPISHLFSLFTHLGVNNNRATVVLSKNRLSKCTRGQVAAKKGTRLLWTVRIKQKRQYNANLTVVGWNYNMGVYIASSESSKPNRFIRRWKKAERT